MRVFFKRKIVVIAAWGMGLMGFILLNLLTTPNAQAKNGGVIGTVYPIAEPDLWQVLTARLIAAQNNGVLAHIQQQLQQNLQEKMDRPQAVNFLRATVKPRSFLWDPALIASTDMTDSQGRVLLPAGSVINPLNDLTLGTTLLFYNAESAAQAAWAQQEDAKLLGHDTLILVGGSVGREEKRLNKRVYFDQGGVLSTRFQLQQVPAMVMQEGNQLRIREVMP